MEPQFLKERLKASDLLELTTLRLVHQFRPLDLDRLLATFDPRRVSEAGIRAVFPCFHQHRASVSWNLGVRRFVVVALMMPCACGATPVKVFRQTNQQRHQTTPQPEPPRLQLRQPKQLSHMPTHRPPTASDVATCSYSFATRLQ